VRDLNKRKMRWIEATRGDGTSTGALEFEVSVEIRIGADVLNRSVLQIFRDWSLVQEQIRIFNTDVEYNCKRSILLFP
jgi:hypothetical protein